MLTLEKIKKTKTDKIGFFRFKKFDENLYLITNDVGKHYFLSENDFLEFISGNIEFLKDKNELEKKGFIKTDDFEDKMTGSFYIKNNFIGVGPLLHMIVTTLRCNHKCKYCHAAVAPMTAKEFDMDKKTAKKVVDTIFYTNSPSLTIEFQGGESLVNYKIVQFIVEYARQRAFHLKKDIKFSLVSNLTLMTEEKMIWLFDNGVDICTSLDGDELIHNHNRTGFKEGNSYKKVTYWIKKINEEREKRGDMGKIGALLTVTKESLPKYKEIIDEYVRLGLDGIFLRWLNPYGFAASDIKTLSYESDEWIEFYKKSLDYIIEINKSSKKFSESITSVYLMKIFNSEDPGFMDIRSPSGLGIGGVAYNYDGKVYASDESRMLGRMGIDDFLMTQMQETGEKTYKDMINSYVNKFSVQSSCLDGLPGYNDYVYKPYLGVDIIHNFKLTGSLYVPMVKDEKMKIQVAILDYIFEKLRDKETEKIFKGWIGK